MASLPPSCVGDTEPGPRCLPAPRGPSDLPSWRAGSTTVLSRALTTLRLGIRAPLNLPPGLPAYNADGGMKNWKLTALLNQSVTGDLTHGLSIFGGGTYSRLVGDIADSPIVDGRGSKSQWQAVLGLAYTF